MVRRAAFVATLLLMLSTSNVLAATSTVKMYNYYYSPKTQRVVIRNSVKWRNPTGKRHDATPTVNWSWGAVSVAPGTTSAVVTPTQTGSFPYFCSLHPTQKGRVNVAMVVSPLAGTTGTYFTVTLGTVTAPGVLVHQLEARRNGGAWALRATTAAPTISLFFPQTGTYELRSRLKYQLGGATSGYSPISTIQVF
jgi:plastocyanin